MWFSFLQHLSERWFGVSKSTCKWSILERTKFATFHFIFHMTELLAVLELIDIIINPLQSFIASLTSLCYCSYQSICCSQKIWSGNSCQVSTKSTELLSWLRRWAAMDRSCFEKTYGQRENGYLVPALQRDEKEEKESVDSTDVETETDGGHVECGSWRKLRMTVRSLSKISCFTWRREKGANYARHLHHDLGSRKNNSSMCPSRTSWDLLRGRWRQAWK